MTFLCDGDRGEVFSVETMLSYWESCSDYTRVVVKARKSSPSVNGAVTPLLPFYESCAPRLQ